MVQSVVLVLGQNLKIGCSNRRDIIIHGNIDKVKFIDSSGGFTVREFFPENKVNFIFHGEDLTLHYSVENIIVFSGYVEGYSIVDIDGNVLGKYELRANGVYVKTVEEE